MEKKKLASLMHTDEASVIRAAEELDRALLGRGIALIETGDAYELRTSPESADIVKKLREGELTKDLGKAGLETLSIILYRSGATRSDIDWIRGVNSAQSVRSLMLRGLIERSEDPSDKRKFRYHATTDALGHLGIRSAKDLPRYAELSKESDEALCDLDHADA